MIGGRPRPKIRAPKRVGVHSDEVDFETTWSGLESSFREIHTKNASNLSYEELYRGAYRIVLKKRGEELYNRVIGFEKEWLKGTVQGEVKTLLSVELMAVVQSTSMNAAERRVAGERFLKGIKQQWQDQHVCMAMLADVLMYLDRVYCTDRHQPSIYTSSMQLFRDHVLKSPTGSADSNVLTVLGVVVNTMLDHIQMERDGDAVDKSMLKACTYMLEGLYNDKTETDDQRLYNVCFEPRYLAASRQFYKAESEQLLRDSDAGAYCRQSRRRLIEEQDRCRSTLSETTTAKIETVVLEELIQNKIKELIDMDTGVKFMIDNDRIDELGLIYDLNARVDDKKTELTKAIQKQIINLGNEVNSTALSPPAKDVSATNQQTIAAIKWVEEILDLKDRFDRFWKVAFQSDQVLQTAMTRSFTDFINSTIFTRGAEYLSLFIDDNMKKGIKDKTDSEIDAVLDKAITLLRYVQEKDMFERYYKKHLARRLLMSKSISMDVEKQMIGKMKIELGNSFTTKLEAMFKDMTISEELTTAFKAHTTSVRESGESDLVRNIDLSINVLTSMTWPLDSVGNINDDDYETRRSVIYPAGIQKVIDRFKLFYSKKHNGRMLTWQPGMGTADIKARFPKLPGREGSKERIHELNVSTYAMIVLSLFNDLSPGESLTFSEILTLTNIPAHDLVRNLQALSVAPKTRVLRKEPMSREVGDSDKFYFNESFTTKFLRVKVGVVASGNRVETERERMKTEKKNEENRNFVCEAAIVRIMKQRKLLPHAQLVGETLQQLTHFKPDVAMIKSRIESLIEREYLERDDDGNKYKYLA